MQKTSKPRGAWIVALLVLVATVATACDGGGTKEPMRERLMGRMADEAMQELRDQGASALPQLVELALDQEAEVADCGVSLIGMLGAEAEPAIPQLIQVLQHPDERVRKITRETLKSLKNWSTTHLIGALSSTSGRLRTEVLHTMSMGLGKDAAPAVGTLTQIVRSGNAQEKTYAAMALASIGSAAESAIPALEAAVDQVKTNDQRRMIKGCIKRIGDAKKPGMYTDSR